jgi:hypothetical protein
MKFTFDGWTECQTLEFKDGSNGSGVGRGWAVRFEVVGAII